MYKIPENIWVTCPHLNKINWILLLDPPSLSLACSRLKALKSIEGKISILD